MSFLARFESFMEQLLETSLRRVLHTSLDITFLKRRLERTMEANQIVVNGKTMVPHYYCVMLNAQDFVHFQKNLAAHQSELVDYLEKLAQSRSFATQRSIRVEIQQRSFVPLRTLFVETEEHAAPAHNESTSDMLAVTDDADAGQRRGNTANVVVPVDHVRNVRYVIEVSSTGEDPEQTPITTTKIAIGRNFSNNVVLGDHQVSRHHAQIAFHARRFQITDLASRNGTFVNGERLSSQAHTLDIEHDIITISHYTIRIKPLTTGAK